MRIMRYLTDEYLIYGVLVEVDCEIVVSYNKRNCNEQHGEEFGESGLEANTRLWTLNSKHACDVHSILDLARLFYSNTAIPQFSIFRYSLLLFDSTTRFSANQRSAWRSRATVSLESQETASLSVFNGGMKWSQELPCERGG